MSDKFKSLFPNVNNSFADVLGYSRPHNIYEDLDVEGHNAKVAEFTSNKLDDPTITKIDTLYNGYTWYDVNLTTETPVDSSELKFTFNEDRYIAELLEYIKSTYTQHYAQGQYQATDMIIDWGHGTGFNIGNGIKYLSRYGKKEGYNRKDLLKALHYIMMQLYVHDTEKLNEKK